MYDFTLESMTTVLLLGFGAALIHMMFQLGVSVLTLLSGHSLGSRKAHLRLLHLNWSYLTGSFLALLLLALSVTSIVDGLALSERSLWILAAILSAVIGCLICLVYYRRGKGTILWIPRGMAEYLGARAKKTKHGIEAGALGAMTVIAELPFAIAPLLIISVLLLNQSSQLQIGTLAVYSLLVTIPLLVITVMVGAGHRISTIQRWRESNKSFLQYSAGLGLIVVSVYLTVFHIIGVSV